MRSERTSFSRALTLSESLLELLSRGLASESCSLESLADVL
jgi:hypothetical protein